MALPALKDCPDYPACKCADKCQRLRDRPPTAKIQSIAHKLIGTCGMGEVQDDLNDLERWECRQLDTIAFACTGCGWWFTAAERKVVDEEWFCGECVEEGRR